MMDIIFLSEVIERVQNSSSVDFEESTSRILAQNRNWNNILLDAPLRNEIDTRIFNVLIALPQFEILGVISPLEAGDAASMLQQAIPVMPNLDEFFVSLSTTESEAGVLFSLLATCPSLKKLYVFLGDTTERLANPLANFIRESTCLRYVDLSFQSGTEPLSPPSVIPESCLRTICDGIRQSASLEVICMSDVPPPNTAFDADAAATIVAQAVAESTSIARFTTGTDNEHNFLQMTSNALLNTPVVQNFDLCFSVHDDDDDDRDGLLLHRSNRWKRLLSKDVPLGLWPRILAKTNAWNIMDSHTPADALFFLVKEKNDVLLQNVRKRKIRKRKRFQIS